MKVAGCVINFIGKSTSYTSPPFNQLTRPGTMRLTWSNAKPELLNTEKGKRKHKAADEKDAKKTKNNIESLSNTSKQKLELEREKIDRDHRFQMEKLKVEKQKWKYKREKLRTSHELKMKKLELRLKQINNYK
ncbi:hypothetical protein GLOIN_2v1795282 [Rhizophagus clarus]|uniref:Uncharacterized protein n=1 Tax=Rhizophagus clarus TaxID=94130 RepID=A0A8H3LQ62_9GLOM|nr:hypothetical protein GLOIN_2v1795282 [Rhizophagus clarus]